MKKFSILVLLMFGVLISAVANETKQILGNNFVLKYSAKDGGHYFNEYVMPNETYNNWTKLFSVYEFPKNSTAMQSAKGLAQMANSRYDGADAQFTACPKNSDCNAMVTFTAYNGSIKEFNVWKYKDYPDRILANQYAIRVSANKNFDSQNIYNIVRDFVKLNMEDVKNIKVDNPN